MRSTKFLKLFRIKLFRDKLNKTEMLSLLTFANSNVAMLSFLIHIPYELIIRILEKNRKNVRIVVRLILNIISE